MLDISDKKRQEQREIYIPEQQGHCDRDQNLNAGPEVDQPPLGNKRKHVTTKKNQNHNDSDDDFVSG